MTAAQTLRINRAPVLTLWAAVVAERLGMSRETALTIGQTLAGITAHAKGVRLGSTRNPESARVRLRHRYRRASRRSMRWNCSVA